VARGQPLSEMALSLEDAELAPAAMLNFRPTLPGGMAPPYLHAGLMASLQVMGEEQIPQGYGGEGATPALGSVGAPGGGGMGGGRDPNRVPAWMRQQ